MHGSIIEGRFAVFPSYVRYGFWFTITLNELYYGFATVLESKSWYLYFILLVPNFEGKACQNIIPK